MLLEKLLLDDLGDHGLILVAILIRLNILHIFNLHFADASFIYFIFAGFHLFYLTS